MTRGQAINVADRAIAVVPEGALWPETRWRAWRFVMMAEALGVRVNIEAPVAGPTLADAEPSGPQDDCPCGYWRAEAAGETAGDRGRAGMEATIDRLTEEVRWRRAHGEVLQREVQRLSVILQAKHTTTASPEAPQRAKPQPPHNQGTEREATGEGRERRVMKVGIARGECWIVDWPDDQPWPTVFLPGPTAEKQSSAIRPETRIRPDSTDVATRSAPDAQALRFGP